MIFTRFHVLISENESSPNGCEITSTVVIFVAF